MRDYYCRCAPSGVLFIASFLFLSLQHEVWAQEADEAAALATIAEVYNQNRECFDAFTCRFTVSEGTSTTLDDAVAGRIRLKHKRNGLWLVNGGLMRYELDCPAGTSEVRAPPAVPERPGPVTTPIDCVPDISLWNKDAQVSVGLSRVFGGVNLHKGSAKHSIIITPLSLGIMGAGEKNSPSALIAGARKGSFCKYRGVDYSTGRPLEVMEVHESDDAQRLTTFHLDLSRGAYPMRVVFKSADGIEGEAVVLSVKQMANKGYLCEKGLMAWKRPKGMAVTLIELTAFDATPPDASKIALDLEPGTRIGASDNMRSFFTLTSPETLRADEVDKWVQRCSERAGVRTAEIAARLKGIPPEPAPSNYWWLLSAGAIAILLVAVFILRRATTAARR